jgi:hypothetical protein
MKTRDDFETWLIFMDDYISRFAAALSPEDQEKLDLSPESLDMVEAWLLKNFPDLTAFLHRQKDGIIDGCIVYVGEVFRDNLGCKWTINVDNPEEQYYQLPVIKNFHDPLIPMISPMNLVLKAVEKRAGWYMRIALLAYKTKGKFTEEDMN